MLTLIKHQQRQPLHPDEPMRQRVRQHGVRRDNDTHIAKGSIPDALLAPTIHAVVADQEPDIDGRDMRCDSFFLLSGERYGGRQEPDYLFRGAPRQFGDDTHARPGLYQFEILGKYS